MDVPPIDRQVRRDVGRAAETTDFGSVHWVERDGDPPGAELTAGLATWHSGKGNVEHIHPNCEEILYVLHGEVEHTLGEQRTVLRTGDLIVIPRNTPHRVFNPHAAIAKTLIVFSSPDRQFVPIEAGQAPT